MAVIFNDLYRMQKNGRTVVMPAPVDVDTPDALWEAQRVEALAPHLGRVGFQGFLWPPLTMAQGGSAPDADGYGKQYDVNVGQFRPTRWGKAEQVLAANEALHAAGLMVLEDCVTGQYDGGNNGVYYELGEDGKVDKTLFPKFPSCFWGTPPHVPKDPVFSLEGSRRYGDATSYVNSTPKGYMLKGLLSSIAWRNAVLALDGRRLDNTKDQNVDVTRDLLALGGHNFCETFTGDPAELERFVQQTGGAVLDFTLHFALQAVCNAGVSFRSLQGNGFYARDPGHAVLFVDTADTDGNNGENIRFNKLWAHLWTLMVPARDVLIYSADYLPERYGLRPWIDNLVWINRRGAFGAMAYEYVSDTLIAFSRNGDGGKIGWSGGLLVALSSDPINHRTEWMHTPFGPNRKLQRYTPTDAPEFIWTNADGWAKVTTPPNVNGSGLSYVVYAPAGMDGAIPVVPIPPRKLQGLTDFTGVLRDLD